MKKQIAMLYFVFPLVLTAAGPSREQMAFYKAYKNGAQAKECLRVVDQDGVPVFGVKIDGGCKREVVITTMSCFTIGWHFHVDLKKETKS